ARRFQQRGNSYSLSADPGREHRSGYHRPDAGRLPACDTHRRPRRRTEAGRGIGGNPSGYRPGIGRTAPDRTFAPDRRPASDRDTTTEEWITAAQGRHKPAGIFASGSVSGTSWSGSNVAIPYRQRTKSLSWLARAW